MYDVLFLSILFLSILGRNSMVARNFGEEQNGNTFFGGGTEWHRKILRRNSLVRRERENKEEGKRGNDRDWSGLRFVRSQPLTSAVVSSRDAAILLCNRRIAAFKSVAFLVL
jgi:hypothetical protein